MRVLRDFTSCQLIHEIGMEEKQRFLSHLRRLGTGGKSGTPFLVDERYRELVKIPPDGILR